MKMLIPLRKTLAAISLVALVLLFVAPWEYVGGWLGWLPKLQFWPAVLALNVWTLLVVLAVTFLCGRVYCAVVCPLGIVQDVVYALRTSGKRQRRFRQHFQSPANRLRYAILVLFVAAVCLGMGSWAHFIEPYSIFGRMVSSPMDKAIPIVVVSAVTLAVLVVLVCLGGRTWCNTICPVGSALSIVSRYSLTGPVIDTDKCVGCGLCGKGCRASCIDTEHHRVDMSRCVACMDCLGNCSAGAIRWGLRPRKSAAKPASSDSSAPDTSRRAFLTASAVALGAAAVQAQQVHGELGSLVERKHPDRKTPIVPPGATSLASFEKHCVGCQLCVSACPNGVLHPVLDLGHLMMPVMDFDKGYCRPECKACSDVCPAGALRKFPMADKSAISIGYAVCHPDRCVVNTDGVSCGNCARHCPAGAIIMTRRTPGDLTSPLLPVVDTARCIGCGRCEHVCPARPVSAIHIEGREVHIML